MRIKVPISSLFLSLFSFFLGSIYDIHVIAGIQMSQLSSSHVIKLGGVGVIVADVNYL